VVGAYLSGCSLFPMSALYAALKRRSSTVPRRSMGAIFEIWKVKGSGQECPLHTNCQRPHFPQRAREMGHSALRLPALVFSIKARSE
jgi:hypothetical protein